MLHIKAAFKIIIKLLSKQGFSLSLYLKLREFICFKLLSIEDEPHDMLREQSKGSKIENFIAVIIHKLKNLGEEKLGAFVLNISFSRGQQSTDSINCNAALKNNNLVKCFDCKSEPE